MVSSPFRALQLPSPRDDGRGSGRSVPSAFQSSMARLLMRSLVGASLLLLASVVPAVAAGRPGDSSSGIQLDDSTYPEEEKYLKIKAKTGDKTLFDETETFFSYHAAPEAQLQLARLQLEREGEPTVVVDQAVKKLAAASDKYAVINDDVQDIVGVRGVGHLNKVDDVNDVVDVNDVDDITTPKDEWVNIAGTGSIWNLRSVQTFCPEVEKVGVARMVGIQRSFRLPSTVTRDKRLISMEKRDWGMISNDIVSGSDSEKRDRAPLGVVLRMPPHCFVAFIWRERRYDLLYTEVDEVIEDKNNKSYVETGKKLWVHLPVESTDEQLKWKLGYFRFREIMEQRAHHPEHPLQEFIDEKAQHNMREVCPQDDVTESPDGWTLRRCFFEMNRDALYRILGQRQFDQRWGETLGVTTTWGKGVEVYPNAVYLRVCLCGAKKVSDAAAKDMATKSYLYDNKTTVKEWLLSEGGLLEFPDDVSLPESYGMARECTVKELMDVIMDERDRLLR